MNIVSMCSSLVNTADVGTYMIYLGTCVTKREKTPDDLPDSRGLRQMFARVFIYFAILKQISEKKINVIVE